MPITVKIHEAKTHLSRLVDQAFKRREFVIAKAGQPLVRVVPLETPLTTRKLGFLARRGTIEAPLKTAFADEIDAMFGSPR